MCMSAPAWLIHCRQDEARRARSVSWAPAAPHMHVRNALGNWDATQRTVVHAPPAPPPLPQRAMPDAPVLTWVEQRSAVLARRRSRSSPPMDAAGPCYLVPPRAAGSTACSTRAAAGCTMTSLPRVRSGGPHSPPEPVFSGAHEVAAAPSAAAAAVPPSPTPAADEALGRLWSCLAEPHCQAQAPRRQHSRAADMPSKPTGAAGVPPPAKAAPTSAAGSGAVPLAAVYVGACYWPEATSASPPSAALPLGPPLTRPRPRPLRRSSSLSDLRAGCPTSHSRGGASGCEAASELARAGGCAGMPGGSRGGPRGLSVSFTAPSRRGNPWADDEPHAGAAHSTGTEGAAPGSCDAIAEWLAVAAVAGPPGDAPRPARSMSGSAAGGPRARSMHSGVGTSGRLAAGPPRQRQAGEATWRQGDVAAAHAVWLSLWRAHAPP